MPLRKLASRAHGVHPEFARFLAAVALIAVCDGIFQSVYNNFLDSQFGIDEKARGLLEVWREMPGLLVVLFMGLLSSLRETRIAVIATCATVAGAIVFRTVGHLWWLMVVATFLWSAGEHLLMPVRDSLGIWFGGRDNRGRRMGQIGAARVGGTILGALAVWVLFRFILPSDPTRFAEPSVTGSALSIPKGHFDVTFTIGAVAALVAGVMFLLIRSVGTRTQRAPFILKSKYWIYYTLHLFYGARKQIFLTFGNWVLVKVYRRPPATFAKLSIVSNVIGVFFTPTVGRVVDRFGERAVLIADACLLVFVCLGYAGAGHLGLSDQGALVVACACFVLDSVLFGVGMARESYMSKIADNERDLTASISLGISINHVVSMVIPTLGGMLWAHYGRHEPVFLVAAGLAAVMACFATRVRVPSPSPNG